jgi:chromosome segregation ATPase
MIYIRLAVSLAVLLAAGWLGYRWGSSGLEKARAELAAIHQTADAAQADKEATQKRLDAQLKALADEHEARIKALSADFAAQKQELSGNLGRANERIASLGSQRQGVAAQLDAARREMETATGVRREELRLITAKLAETEARLRITQEGVRCELIPVPDTEVATLNRVLEQP